jgi:hypothetical protein
MLSLQGYRDVSATLQTSPYNIYAEWIVSEINNKAANNETFIFNTDGYFLCDESSLPTLAISNDDVKYPYYWDDEEQCFSTQDDKYQIYIEDYENIEYTSNTYVYITLRCVNGDKENIYKCQKINELDEYYEATVVVNTADTSDYELIQAYLEEMKKKEAADQTQTETPAETEETEPDESEENPDEDTSSDNSDNESDPEEEEEDAQRKKKTFYAEVVRVYDDALLVVPDEEYEEADIAEKFIVLYENADELEVGDIISVMYIEDIDTEAEPPEIEAYKIKYIDSAASEPDEEDDNSDESNTDEGEDSSENDDNESDSDDGDEEDDDEGSGFFF